VTTGTPPLLTAALSSARLKEGLLIAILMESKKATNNAMTTIQFKATAASSAILKQVSTALPTLIIATLSAATATSQTQNPVTTQTQKKTTAAHRLVK